MSEARWELPQHWKWVSARDVGQIVGGGTPSTRDPTNFVAHGIPWITPADLTGYAGKYISRGARDLSQNGYDSSGARLMPAGSVLFSSRAPIGYCVIASNELATNQGFKSLVPSPDYSPEFLRYYLVSAKEYAEGLASGTTFKELSGARMATLAVPMPPLPEQRRIVAKLDTLTTRTARAREELERIPRLIQKYREAILAAAYSSDLTREWRQRERLPNTRLGKVAELLSVPIRNGLSVRGCDSPPGQRSLRLSALRSRLVDLEDVRYLPIDDSRASRYLLETGDVLVSRGNGTKAFVGIASIVPDIVQPTIFPDTAFRIRLSRTKALPDWFASIWNAPQLRRQIEAAAKTTAGIWKISQSDIAAFELPIPHIDEQQEIIRRIETAFGWLDLVTTEHANASRLLPKLDQAILAKAFRGELVLPERSEDCSCKHIGDTANG